MAMSSLVSYQQTSDVSETKTSVSAIFSYSSASGGDTHLGVKTSSTRYHNAVSQMLEKLQSLRDRPLVPELDFRRPSKAAVGALEEIVELLPGGTPKAHIAPDGHGGVQITWRAGRTFLVVSASSGGSLVPDVFFMVRQNGKSETSRFETPAEFATSITENLPLITTKG